MTKFEVPFYIVTCLVALAIHPLADFRGIDIIFTWGGASAIGIVALLLVSFNARRLGAPLHGAIIAAIAYAAPFAGLAIFFAITAWGDMSVLPMGIFLPSLTVWLVVPFGFPFAVALTTVILGACGAWKRGDRRLVAAYAAVPLCAVLCFLCGAFVADSTEIAWVAPKLDAAVRSRAADSSVDGGGAAVVVLPRPSPVIAAYVLPGDGWGASALDADVVVRDLAHVGPKRAGQLLRDVRAGSNAAGCTSNVRPMGGAYYDVVVGCDRR